MAVSRAACVDRSVGPARDQASRPGAPCLRPGKAPPNGLDEADELPIKRGGTDEVDKVHEEEALRSSDDDEAIGVEGGNDEGEHRSSEVDEALGVEGGSDVDAPQVEVIDTDTSDRMGFCSETHIAANPGMDPERDRGGEILGVDPTCVEEGIRDDGGVEEDRVVDVEVDITSDDAKALERVDEDRIVDVEVGIPNDEEKVLKRKTGRRQEEDRDRFRAAMALAVLVAGSSDPGDRVIMRSVAPLGRRSSRRCRDLPL